jgi:methylated-DNA-protein-cysteine methyltransferase-like protein
VRRLRAQGRRAHPRRKAVGPGTTPGETFLAIYRTVASIPRGCVATYGQVALMAGLPGAARTVGWALRALNGEWKAGRRIPWHRVVGAGGVISLGDTPSGHEQRARLRAEGVEFSRGRVVMQRCSPWSHA